MRTLPASLAAFQMAVAVSAQGFDIPPFATDPVPGAVELLSDGDVAAVLALPMLPRCARRLPEPWRRQGPRETFTTRGSPGLTACTPQARIGEAATLARNGAQPFGVGDAPEPLRRAWFEVFAIPPTVPGIRMTAVEGIVLRDTGRRTTVEPVQEERHPMDPATQGTARDDAGLAARFRLADAQRLAAASPKGTFLVTVQTNDRAVDFELDADELGLR